MFVALSSPTIVVSPQKKKPSAVIYVYRNLAEARPCTFELAGGILTHPLSRLWSFELSRVASI